MGEGYANARPPIHPIVIERVLAHIKHAGKFGRVLDIGCGAGLSTRPLVGTAARVIAIDRYESMVQFGAKVAPGAHFLAARSEALPVADGTIDMMTAAGSLNYSDLNAFFPEAARVLISPGLLIVYDFSQGKRFRDSNQLEQWFGQFLEKYPAPPDPINYLDGEILGRVCDPLRMAFHQSFEIGLKLSHQFYANYIMTETNISHAVGRGASEAGIRHWIESSLAPVFAGEERDVLFNGYFACLMKP